MTRGGKQLGRLFPTNATSQNATKFQNKTDEETNFLTQEFINNSAHLDAVVTDPDFRTSIDYLMNNGHDLKVHYQHMV